MPAPARAALTATDRLRTCGFRAEHGPVLIELGQPIDRDAVLAEAAAFLQEVDQVDNGLATCYVGSVLGSLLQAKLVLMASASGDTVSTSTIGSPPGCFGSHPRRAGDQALLPAHGLTRRKGWTSFSCESNRAEGELMPKPITPDVVVAYTLCPRKAYLLLCTDEQGSPHDYPRILAADQSRNQASYLNGLKQRHGAKSGDGVTDLRPSGGPLLAVVMKTSDCEAYCDSLTSALRVKTGRGQYQPALATATHKVTQEQRLALLFVGYVLGQVKGPPPSAGTIIGTDGRTHKVSLDRRRYAELEGTIDTLRTWIQAPSADAPPAVLNKHCPLCPFRVDCRAKAEHDDDLSLLERMTPRARQRYHDRGIFSVKQLSYVRPRRKRKPSSTSPARHVFELQALALRTGKTYLHEPPALVRQQPEIFLDFEGVPDRDSQYLLGLLVCQQDDVSYHAFWADTGADEERIWRELLTTLAAYPDATLYHYGQYEARAMRVLLKRYQPAVDALPGRLVNLNAYVYGKVYFPVRSNRLKDIGHWLSVSWPTAEVSGFDSLVWRHRWDESHDDADKQLLVAYNRADCQALRALADELTRLRETGAEDPDVDSSTRPKKYATDTGGRLHRELETILQSAHAEYEHTKISLRRDQPVTPDGDKKRVGGQPGHRGHSPTPPKVTKVVQVSSDQECPRCGRSGLRTTTKLPDKTIVDLAFTSNGCRKTVTKYVGAKAYCPQCGERSCVPPAIGVLPKYSFGRGLQAWTIYQRMVLRLPYRVITQALEEQFHVRVSEGTIVAFMRHFARDYAETEARCHRQLLCSPFIHADETKINIKGTDYYAWVFTDGRHVLFRLSATRESVVVQEVLDEYTGILVSDFYGGYDAVPCRQQKCLVHLIRDLDNDLWRKPFDAELETFVLDVRDLLVPILEATNRYGLKKRNLHKFTKSVDRFYQRVITSRTYRSEPVRTYQKRFQRYRQSLFTFLEYDGIPWNNNMGERALRHLAVQRKISGSFSESLAPGYLLLLGLTQTCRFQDKSLLKFLLSGEKDVDAFKPTKRRGRATAPGPRIGKNADGVERAIPVPAATSKAGSVLAGDESLSMPRRRKPPEQLLKRGGDALSAAEERIVELERENRELRRANKILRAAGI